MKKFKQSLKQIFALFIILGFYACSSSSPDDDGKSTNFYIKAKINGQLIEVNNYSQALLQGGPTIFALNLYARNNLKNVYPFFTCDIDNLNNVSVGTYSSATHNMLFQFHNSNKIGYIDADINNIKDFTLQITEVTSTYVKGTFQGILWEETQLTETISVTEGKLYLPRYYGEHGNTTQN
ncbi:MAG: hypothetical protein R2814_12445 [Flavobacteriaceae bacterium]